MYSRLIDVELQDLTPDPFVDILPECRLNLCSNPGSTVVRTRCHVVPAP